VRHPQCGNKIAFESVVGEFNHQLDQWRDWKIVADKHLESTLQRWRQWVGHLWGKEKALGL
jgi:aminoglycoside phosphotransferase (APT) family kinase protein